MNDLTINGYTVRHLLVQRARAGQHPANARELADMLGELVRGEPFSESYISHLLNGRKHAPELLPDIAALLGVVDWRAIATCRHGAAA